LVAAWSRHRRDASRAGAWATLVAATVFALGLLVKILLNVRLYHYGFYLALPATMILTVFLVWFVPHFLEERWEGGAMFRQLSLAALAVFCFYYLRDSYFFYQLKTFPVGRAGDRMIGYDPEFSPRDALAAEALDRIERDLPPGATLLVLPEGAALNYLARRVNPTPFINFTPVETRAYGELNIVSALAANPPDWIAVVHQDGRAEYGVGFFGQDPYYGRMIMTWVYQNYRAHALIGNEPLRDEHFGIKLFRRR
jgi:hypothetical protein